MNSIARLLLELGEAGVEVVARGDRLRHRPATLAPDLRARLRMHKLAVLTLLVDGYDPDPAAEPEAAHKLAERLGIADDLGMPTNPGSPAWLIAVGESLDTTCDTESIGLQSRAWQQ